VHGSVSSVISLALVGAAEGCDLLILFSVNQNQKIAAFGSSYRGCASIDGSASADRVEHQSAGYVSADRVMH
jgi:hypothetical protein